MMKMRRFDLYVGRAAAAAGVLYVFVSTLLDVPPLPDDRRGRTPYREPSFGRSSKMPVTARWGRPGSAPGSSRS